MTKMGPAFAGAALVAVLGVAACSGAEPGPPPPASSTTAAPDPDLVEWLAYVCASDKRFQELANTVVPTDTNPPEAQVLEFVTTLRQGIETLIGLFQEIDPAPVPGGDEVVAAYVQGLTEILPAIKEEEGPVTFVEGTNLTLLSVQLNLITLAPRGADLPGLVEGSAEVRRAFENTPVCQTPPVPATARAAPPTT